MKTRSWKTRLPAWILVIAMLIALLPATVLASDAEYDASDAVSFVFSDSDITTTDTTHTSNYKISGTALSIKAAGTYILSGSCADGSVTVKKGTTGVVLVLNGLNLTSTGSAASATAPLTCNKSTGVTIVAAAGTTNTLTDSIYNNDETYTANEDAENAVLKCKDGSQVALTGSGTLNIVANGKNGIKSGTTDTETDAANPRDAFLTIENLTLNITANVNDALNAEQNLQVLSGSLNIAAEDDAIHSDYNLTIGAAGTAGPTINITKCYEGIEGAAIAICSGNITMQCSDDCINAANADLTGYSFDLTISGGKIYAYTTTGDGFDSNGTMTISGGEVEVWSANTSDNQPLDADSTIYLTGGTVFAAGGSSGMGTKLSATQAYAIFGTSGGSQRPGQGGGQRPGSQQPGKPGSQTTSIAAGNYVNVIDSSSNIVYSTVAPCKTTYVLFSAPSLSSSESYSLDTGVVTHTHTWDNGTVTTAATCTADGVMTYTCTLCGQTKTETIAQLGHDYQSVVTPVACTEGGYTTYTCTRCGDTYTADETSALGHSWNDGEVTTEATCDAEGVKTYTCTVCGATKTEAIPKLPEDGSLRIVTQPVGGTATYGQTVTISVQAANAKSYQWYYSKDGGESWTRLYWTGAKTDTLTVEYKASRSAYQYQCLVTGNDGTTIYTDATTIAKGVAPDGVITKDPENICADIGETVSFSITAENAITYQWFYSKDDGTTWTKLYWDGYDSDTLTFEVKEYRYSYIFYCKITDGNGNSDYSTRCYLRKHFALNAQPQNVTAAIGSSANLTVSAVGVQSYQWYYSSDNGSTWKKLSWTGAKSDTLTVDVTKTRCTYLYRCELVGYDGTEATTNTVKITAAG